VSDPRRWSEDYVAHVLRPNFSQAKRYLFKPLLMANKAHTVMLERCGLLEPQQAQKLLSALRQIDAAGSRSFAYSERFEDLYFAVESRLIELAGVEAGGNLQIARSRNDLDAAMIRMVLRETILGILEAMADLRRALIDRALENVDSIMPGYTHNQPAQPTTLAHYLGSVIAMLERDARRFHMAFGTVNRSPLGAAAMTTTGFPIRRDLSAELLGFEGLVVNGIDAVGSSDHALESVNAVLTCESNLSRFNFDLLTWSTREVNFLRVPDHFVQISSIMPQKRNPVVLEHVRAKLARAHGAALTVLGLARNVPNGDINDVGEHIINPVLSSYTELDEALNLLSSLIETCGFNTPLMLERAGEHFTTATALADFLVAELKLPFRTAHHITSKVVNLAYARNLSYREVNAALVNEAAEQSLEISDAQVRQALDPQAFIAARRIPGGTAREAILPFLSDAQTALEADERWRRSTNSSLRHAKSHLEAQVDSILEP
jgi:argininosuccinate lyase